MKYINNWKKYTEGIYEPGTLDLYRFDKNVIKRDNLTIEKSKKSTINEEPKVEEPKVEEPIIQKETNNEQPISGDFKLVAATSDKNTKIILFKYNDVLYKWDSSGKIYNSKNELISPDENLHLNEIISKNLPYIKFINI